MIKLKNIQKVYSTDTIETTALERIDLHIQKGEFVSVMGPSGCGKSTLLNIMGLIDKPSEGTLYLGGEEVSAFSDRKTSALRNREIGFIFQSFHLIGDLSVIDNVEVPLLYRKVSARERKRLAEEALEKVGLGARKKHFPRQLSGGQKQRVAIARAIIGKPMIILADEPTGNLDSRMGEEIINILRSLNDNQDVTVVMVTHDEGEAEKTERIIRLFDGSLVAAG